MVKMVLFNIIDAYNVESTEPKKTAENTILCLDIKCKVYFFGPCNIPKDNTNNNDPNDHSKPNFLGFNANTGNIKKLITKHNIDPDKHIINPTSFSKLLN